MKKKKYSGSLMSKPFYADGGIHINPDHEGAFTAFAQSMGMSVQEAAAHVLANRDQYSPMRVQQANFARNAAGWRKQMGGLYETPSFIASGLAARKVPCLECGGGLPRADAGGSIVDYLGRQNVDASFANRKKLYNQYFNGAYKGTADQNTHLLELLRTQDAQPPAPEPEAIPTAITPVPVSPASGGAAPSYTPFFQTEEERDAYEKRLGDVASRALWWGDDSDFLRFTSYHPKADGNDCINGVCGLNLKAGLQYSHPTDVDRYLGNTKFTESLQKGMEDYYQTYQPRVGTHLQKLDDNGKPFHSMLVYKIDRDDKGKPTKYHVIHNGGDTKFVEKVYTPEDIQEELRPTDRKNPYMIAWNPGLYLDRAKLEKERKGEAPFPYNQSEEDIRRHFGETSLPTRFSLREDQGLDPNSPLYYLSGKDVQDQTRNELLGYFNDKDLDRQLRERLRIDDVTLQNLKPYIFGIMGVESNDQNVSAARDLKERAAQLLKSDPSLGPFQIRLGSVGDRAKKAFDIYEQDDLSKDLRKGYIAAVDRMLEAKRVMDDRVAKGYHPELAKADPYARAVYYYNQPQRVLMSDEDYAKKNFVYQPFTIPNPMGKDWRFSTGVNASQDDLKSAYEKFLEESRLRGDRGSYMDKVRRAAYPLLMEVLDDEEPRFGIADAQLPAVEVVGKRKPKIATRAKGGMVSTEGYKADSPDRFNAFNIIPSNQITMQNVPHPVMGVDTTGATQLMLPGANYVFPGQAVLEVPLRDRESPVQSRESGAGSQGLRRAQQGGVAMVIPPFTLETRLHEPKATDSMLPADSPVYNQKQTLDASIKQREILSRTPAQQAAYEKALVAKRIAEENRKEWLRQQELDRRAKIIEQSDAIQDNTSFFSPERWGRRNLAAISQATPERFRFFPESVGGAGEFVDDYLNPLRWVGNLAKGFGEAPLQAQQTNSVAPYFKAVGTPLVSGAIGINPVTTITNPVKGVFTSKGLAGQAENLWENVIKSNVVDNLKDKAIEGTKETLVPEGEETASEAGYRYGGRYPQNSYKQQGGPVDETQRQKDWFLSYVNSQNYLDLLKMQGFSNPEAERQARLQNLRNLPPVKYSRDLGWNQGAYMPREYKGMMYKQGWVPAAPEPDPIFGIETPGTVYLAPQYAPGKTPEARFSTTPAHEYSHVTNDGGFRIPDKMIEKIYRYTLRNSAPERFEKVFAPAAKDVPDQTQYRIQITDPDPQSPVWGTKQGTSFVLNAPEAGEIQIPYRGRFVTRKFGPVNDPSEFQARLDAALYKANELGIYDARTQRLDKETFRRILNDPRMRENSDFQEFYGILQGDDAEKEEEVLDLTNTTAKRSNGNGSTVARYGGRVRRKSYESPPGAGDSSGKSRAGGLAGKYRPSYQAGGGYGDTSLYPFGTINPFDVDPYSLTNPVGSTPAPAAPASPAVPSGPIPNFQNFMRNSNVLSKDNPVATDQGPYTSEFDLSGLGQIKGFKEFMTKKTILSKDNQNPFGVNAPFADPASKAPQKTVWEPNVGAASALIRDMAMFNTALESGNRNRYKQQERIRNLGDNKGPVLPADWEERKGDYDVNNGGFRFNRIIQPQFGVAAMGGFFSEAKQNVPVMPAPPLPVLPNVPVPSFDPSQMGGDQPEMKMPSIKVNERVKPNEAAWDAFNYYVNEENLAPHVAAGIVGNLAVESAGFDPDVISGKRRGDHGTAYYIPQLRGGRQKDFHKWAERNHLDPLSVQTQLAFVRHEADQRGDLAAVKKAKTASDAAILFGKRYERPADKSAQWDVRAGIAEQLYNQFIQSQQDMVANSGEADDEVSMYKAGGEYMVSPSQLRMILARGGEVEYLR